MEEKQSILHELYVFSEWKPEPEYMQKPDNILPENISALWRWLKFFGPKKNLIDSITAYKEQQQKWHIALGNEGKVLAVLTDNILEIRTKRSEYATIAARTTVSRDAYPQWRKVVWSPDCSFVVIAYGNGVVSFFDLTATLLFNIPADCTRPEGLECSDNTHAVADIIFMPLRVKDNKWNWEVLIATFDGKLRGYLVSQTDGFKLHHTATFTDGIGAFTYSAAHSLLYVAGLPRGKDPSSPLHVGITAWRILNDDPFYRLSAVFDQFEASYANERFHIYVPFVSRSVAIIVNMVISPDGSKLVCLHCTGEVSIWHLPLLKPLHRWPLALQPQHDEINPLVPGGRVGKRDAATGCPADVSWWTDEDIIISRFSGAVTVCRTDSMRNRLGSSPLFLQGAPRLSAPRAYDHAFMALECEASVLPAKRSDPGTEVVPAEADAEDSMFDLTKELFKSVLYAITDIETFQPRPRRITVVTRVYRLLGIKSTTPEELFSRKIESGQYEHALTLADTFDLDSDLVYQQQWRQTPVSTDTIHQYLSKVSKKIWAVHQCTDRLPETLPAAKELLQFGLQLTTDEILNEINNDREDGSRITDPTHITLEDLNAYTSELLRCRHVMLFYRERLCLYEAILRSEKSTYVKDEYDRLRSHTLLHSATELAREGRVAALACLWTHIRSAGMQMAVLENLPETINPLAYYHLLPGTRDAEEDCVEAGERAKDWCEYEQFRSIWNSNWSEDASPDSETAAIASDTDISVWYEKRIREIEELSGLVSHAETLANLASQRLGVKGLENIAFHLATLSTLTYDLYLENERLKHVEEMTTMEICKLLMTWARPDTFIANLQTYVVPYLKRLEERTGGVEPWISGLINYMASVSVDDLSTVLNFLSSPRQFEVDVRTQLELATRCLYAHTGTDQLDKACDLLQTVMKDTDGSIPATELLRRLNDLERLVTACGVVWWRGVPVPLYTLKCEKRDPDKACATLTRMARSAALAEEKLTPQDWEKLLKDILQVQSILFQCVSKEQCYEIYGSALLTSGDAPSIRLASEVLTCDSTQARRGNTHLVPYDRSVALVSNAAREYINSAAWLADPALELARCCLTLIKDSVKSIEEELDLISGLELMSAFGINILPIQVRLCENRMELIEACLKKNPNAFLASHKLLKLGKLLRIAGDDDQKREGQILQLVCAHGAAAGRGGAAAAAATVEAARRLAALRHAPAADLIAQVASNVPAQADRTTRRDLFASAVTYCAPESIEQMLRSRLNLELEGLQQMGSALRELGEVERSSSIDDEFADAITTPVIEKKDLVSPSSPESKIPLFNYLLETWQGKFNKSDSRSTGPVPADKAVRCGEFYRSLYPHIEAAPQPFAYERFSVAEDALDSQTVALNVMKWYYIQNCLDAEQSSASLECEVVQKCAKEVLYRDTALSVACLLRSTQDCALARRLVASENSRVASSVVLYATLVKCNAPELRDNVYLTKPEQMARITLSNSNASSEQLELIGHCLERLMALVEVNKLKSIGVVVNGPLFAGDPDYRREVIYRVASLPNNDYMQFALSLARKYDIEPLELWLQHVATVINDGSRVNQISLEGLAETDEDKLRVCTRLRDDVYEALPGDAHGALINVFTLLKQVDERFQLSGLTAADHIKLLKKAKAASPELNYKLLLSQPSREELCAHLLLILRPENVGLLTKLLRTLPAPLAPPLPVHELYAMWLTKYFFSVSASGHTNKKWMQQYRQCASYFNKLSKDGLLEFVTNTCFSDEAVERVPAGTRNLMIMQAVDYCQQEQENDLKLNKNEATWAQISQELTRWARFLENFHSSTIQGIVANTPVSQTDIWAKIEQSHGDVDKLRSPLSRLVLHSDLRAQSLATLLQCLHVELRAESVFEDIVRGASLDLLDMQTLVTRLTQYHRDGVKFPEELLEGAMKRATQLGLPPHRQIALLALSQRSQIQDGDDLAKVVKFTLDVLKGEWAGEEVATRLEEEHLLSEEGRRDTFRRFAELSSSWQQKKALVDVLNCWPPSRPTGERSLHCVHLHQLLSQPDHREGLVLIKLLLRKPVLIEEEIIWLSDNVPGESILNLLWVIILSKCEESKNNIPTLVQQHKDYIQTIEVEEDLVKELLDSQLFTKLVPTPLYTSVINYIINQETSNVESEYSINWATRELLKANYLAEAGQLQLMVIGVPTALRGFTQSVLYCKNMLSKN